VNQCRRNWFREALVALAALVGLGPRAARGAGYHPTHNCPRCGRLQLVVYCRGPGRYHTHRCGTTTYWYH